MIRRIIKYLFIGIFYHSQKTITSKTEGYPFFVEAIS